MAKALALFASGLVRAPWLPDADSRLTELTNELTRARSTDGAWGYEFPVQTRWAFYEAHSPNIIATSFVIEGLRDGQRLAEPGTTLTWLEREMISADGFLRYVPNSERLIHNANLLGARALMRLAPGHPAIAKATAISIEHQRTDGLWPYGEGEDLTWVDNFHTAYVLLCLNDLQAEAPDAARALRRGVAAWLEHCFEPDGTPRYYAGKSGPRDVHNSATAVHALATLSDHDGARAMLPGALTALLSMQRPDGAFVARRGAPAYMRWNQAHAFRALAEVIMVD